MKLKAVYRLVPGWRNALLALLSAGLLVLAFPPFELWFTAWFALVPLLWAVEREKDSIGRSFVLGWLFGNVFFFGTCWWLTFAPITYAGFPAPLAYFLLFCVTSVAAVFPGIFAATTAFFRRRFGPFAFLAAPFVWVFTEFLRYWLTGNDWNAIGYSQAFSYFGPGSLPKLGGVLLVCFYIAATASFLTFALVLKLRVRKPGLKDFVVLNAFIFGANPLLGVAFALAAGRLRRAHRSKYKWRRLRLPIIGLGGLFTTFSIVPMLADSAANGRSLPLGPNAAAYVAAVQPNVPMSGLNESKWRDLRRRHVELADSAAPDFRRLVEEESRIYSMPELRDEKKFLTDFYRSRYKEKPRIVVFPESPMNYMYDDDPETKRFINEFAATNNVSVLFNSAEPDPSNGKYFNSAVLVGPDGKEAAQYDKIYLLPFGEAVPFPLEGILPGFVGNFSYGREYDLLPLGDAKAGVMICFESHFGQLSREYVRNGADAIIEMTNDGYLGPTPVLRQHLANAVFRAVETNRPVLRVTNVGITAYVDERGEVLDAADSYVEATRVWSVAKSDGSQTFYVKYGDWFAWLCTFGSFGLVVWGLVRRNRSGLANPAD